MHRTLNFLQKYFRVLLVLALVALYLINCLSPLRLTNDTVRYFNIKEWIEAGKPAGAPAATDFLPYGYVWFLLVLQKLSLCRPLFISFIQLCYFLAALWFVQKLFKDSIAWWKLFSFALLNWASLKFVITPLSEMQFLFFTTASLYFFDRWMASNKNLYLLWSVLFCAAAIFTRTAGLALAAALCITLMIRNSSRLIKHVGTYPMLLVATGGVVFIIVYARPLHVQEYVSYLGEHFAGGVVQFFYTNIREHLTDLAALFINAPGRKLYFIPVSLMEAAYFTAGLCCFGYMLYLLLHRNGKTPVSVKVYVFCYLAVILNWPYYEPRFFVPLLPFFIAVLLQHIVAALPLVRKLVVLYSVAYVMAGIAAITYYTYTSLHQTALATKQDAAIWRNEYEIHFFGKALSDTATAVRPGIVRMLKRYD